MFIILKIIYFDCGFSAKVICAFVLQDNIKKLLESKHDILHIILHDILHIILHIIDQITVTKIPL